MPAGRAARAELGTVGISFGIQQSTGDTSRPSSPMQKYKPISGKTQGTK